MDGVAGATPPGPVLSLGGVSRVYTSGDIEVPALVGATLDVYPGDYLSIVGPSGSGKSTLLNILGLLDRPTEGSYLFEGIEVADLDDTARTAIRGRRIGFVFQSFHLLSHRTVVENVTMSMLYSGAPAAERQDRALRALEAVGLAHRGQFAPTRLSGGERQRVAIARAIVSQPAVLLADEPTGNLDSHTSGAILELFEQLRDMGLTVVMITHDSTVAARAERSVRIHDGRLSAVAA